MFSSHNKFSENLIFFTLTSFIFMSILGIGVGMEMKDGEMSSCPFTAGQEAMCQMSITEHIAQWQQAFLGIPTRGDFLAFAVLLFAVALIPFAKQFFQLEKLTIPMLVFSILVGGYFYLSQKQVFDFSGQSSGEKTSRGIVNEALAARF